MSLSADQFLSLYEALEVPASTQEFILSDDGTRTVSYDIAQQAQIAAKNIIDTFVASMPSANIARLVNYLSDWDEVKTVSVGMSAGNIGQIGGLTQDYNQSRALVQNLICGLVPFRREHDRIAAQLRDSSVVWLTR